MKIEIFIGVNHGEEKRYILTQNDLKQYETPENVAEKKVLRRMVKLWSNFAKTGSVYRNIFIIIHKIYNKIKSLIVKYLFIVKIHVL